jgi:hypothetical protein
MSDGEVFAWFIFGGIGLVCAVGLIVAEIRKGPGKQNRKRPVRVPRETSWSRAAKYYDQQREKSLKYLAQHPNEKPF